MHSTRNGVHTILIGFNSPYFHTGFTPAPIETTCERFRGWGYFTELLAMRGGYKSITTYILSQLWNRTPDPGTKDRDSIRVSAVYDGSCDISLTDIFHDLVPHLRDTRVQAVMNSIASLYYWRPLSNVFS
ncbi:MAG: hypothetical protein QW813_03145 [Candidatus Aenigmatarchaeota archaeon]